MLSQIAERTIRYAELIQANVDFTIGSEDLISTSGTKNQGALDFNKKVITSREAFYYEFLGLKANQLGYTDHEKPAPIDVFIAGARTYFGYGINPKKLLVYGDRALRTAPEFIDAAVKEITAYNLDHVQFFENSPMIGTVRPHVLRKRIAYFLETVGVSAKQLQGYSSVTARSEENMNQRNLVFAKWGLDEKNIGKRFLRAYSLSPENIDKTLQTLNDLGIGPDAVARYPSLIGNSTNFIRQRASAMDTHLKDIGFVTTGAEVLYESPIYFGAHGLKIDAFMTLMKHHKDACKQPLPDNAKTFKRFERTPIRRLMANVILSGYFGLNTNLIGKIDEEQVVSEAMVNPKKLSAIGRPSVVAYINYTCKANPQERDRMLQITELLAA